MDPIWGLYAIQICKFPVIGGTDFNILLNSSKVYIDIEWSCLNIIINIALVYNFPKVYCLPLFYCGIDIQGINSGSKKYYLMFILKIPLL